MKRDKILLQIENMHDLEKYEKLGITNFLFPLEGYSVGYSSFTFEEIAKSGVEAYVLANKLLTDDDIDEFLKMDISHNVRGFIIEDTGLYAVLKDKGYTLINFQNHLNANYKTCNYWLERFDSFVISTDITIDEIEKIVEEAIAPVVLNAFGYPMIMYSRRHLVSNYYENFALEGKKEITIEDDKGEFVFRLRETEYGTAVFDTKILDAREEVLRLPEEKILFYLINTSHIPFEVVAECLDGKEIDGTTKGFLTKKTVYRIGDLK